MQYTATRRGTVRPIKYKGEKPIHLNWIAPAMKARKFYIAGDTNLYTFRVEDGELHCTEELYAHDK